jgi:dienelactone hydrolase
MKDHITIEGHEGAFNAYIARPRTTGAPAVVVLQELFGVNADIRKHCDELAEQGYLALAPDLRKISTDHDFSGWKSRLDVLRHVNGIQFSGKPLLRHSQT